jgi:hypothetical protein
MVPAFGGCAVAGIPCLQIVAIDVEHLASAAFCGRRRPLKAATKRADPDQLELPLKGGKMRPGI